MRAEGPALLVTDGRYAEQAEAQLATAGVSTLVELAIAGRDANGVLASRIPGETSLGLEAEHVTWADHRRYASEWLPGIELVPTEGLVGGLRAVKDDAELELLARAAAIADAALEQVLHRLAHGPTESEFRDELEAAMRAGGAEAPSFETIVASGPNSSRPHARPSDRRVRSGDTVVLDFGALVQGYHSDMTRTVHVGGPSPDQRKVFDVVHGAQQAGVDAVEPGRRLAAVDAACRDAIALAGYGERFVHGTGHGVGLDIHEDPWVAGWSSGTLVEGHVVTVEPGIYLPGEFGVRIEDTVVVTPDGCRRLTNTPKHLEV